MPSEPLDLIRKRIIASVNALHEINYDEEVAAHLDWEFKEMMSRLTLNDLTATEKLAMLAVLCPAHARLIAPKVDKGRSSKRLKVIS